MNHFTKLRIYYKAMQTKYGVVFLTILGVFTAVFIGYLIYSHCEFVKFQDKVKNCYEEHIKRADSLYLNVLLYNKDVVLGIQKISDATLADSLIKASLANARHLSKTQSNKLGVIIESHFKEIELLHKKYDEKLSRDSLRLSVERDLLNGQTKTMIDLHLNKIEHEYSNITLWAAVLTILFLVFSFYSVFKVDELVKQGMDGLKEIRRIKAQGEQTVERLNKDGEDLLKSTEEKIKGFVMRQQRIMIESNREFEMKKSEIGEFLQNLNTTNLTFESEMEKLRSKYEREFSQQQAEFRNLVVEINKFFTHLKEQNPAE